MHRSISLWRQTLSKASWEDDSAPLDRELRHTVVQKRTSKRTTEILRAPVGGKSHSPQSIKANSKMVLEKRQKRAEAKQGVACVSSTSYVFLAQLMGTHMPHCMFLTCSYHMLQECLTHNQASSASEQSRTQSIHAFVIYVSA